MTKHIHDGEWCSPCVREGVARMLLSLIGKDSGGFIPAERGIKDKDGKAEDWVSVGWVFECYEHEKEALSDD